MRRAWVAAGVWGGGALLLLAASGVGSRYRVPSLAGGAGALVAVLGLLTALILLRSAARWFFAAAVGLVLVAGIGVQVLATAAAPTVIAEGDSEDGSLRASLEEPKVLYVVDNVDALKVRVVRPGIVSKDLGSFCVLATSSPPERARIHWNDAHSLTVTMPSGYGYGPWHLRIEGDEVRPTGNALRPC